MNRFLVTVVTLITVLVSASAQTPFNVTGILDKTVYNDSVTLNVVTEPGYTYALYLNGTNMAAGGAYTIRHPDFYQVQAFRTNVSTGAAVTNRYFRIIVMDKGKIVEAGSHDVLVQKPQGLYAYLCRMQEGVKPMDGEPR